MPTVSMELERDMNSQPPANIRPLALPPKNPKGVEFFITAGQSPEGFWHGLFYLLMEPHRQNVQPRWTLMFSSFSRHPSPEQALLHFRERLEACGLMKPMPGSLAVVPTAQVDSKCPLPLLRTTEPK